MDISFDLDSTLIPNGEEFITEKRSKLAKLFGIEKIREGSPELISYLQNNGHTVHIYTTSFRSKRKIRFTLMYYGIKVSRIINQKENQRKLKSIPIKSSKYPTAFKFDLHIDDLKGVGIEAEKFNFKAIIIKPCNVNWVKEIKSKLNNIT